MTTDFQGRSEFSRPVPLDRLNSETIVRSLTASSAECAALAARFKILAVQALSGTLRVTRPGGGPTLRVEGQVEADVVQTCVITLQPCEQHLAEAFVQRFTLEPEEELEEVFSDPEAEEPAEPLTGESLDFGEVLAEQLALALDPYPRAAGATFEGAHFGSAASEGETDAGWESESPFAVLKTLKREK